MKEDIDIAAIAKKAGCGRDVVFHTVLRQRIKAFDMVNVASGFRYPNCRSRFLPVLDCGEAVKDARQ
jgi:hypothetical protein